MASIHLFEDEYINQQKETFHKYPTFSLGNEVPLVIDNGSFRCRAGWSTEKEPRMNFRNLVMRQRSKKESEAKIGNNITNIETVRWLLRTQFDRDVVTHFDVQEQIFDHIFHHLGIQSNERIEHPVVLTESVCNPNYCRRMMTELLFECYQVPSLACGIDSLFSFYQNESNHTDISDGLVVSFGYHNSCTLPFLNGKLDSSKCHRVNVGGFQQAAYLHRLLQMKYPVHANSINVSRCEGLLIKHGYVSREFLSELGRWSSNDYYQKHVCRVQLPYMPLHSWSDDSIQQSFQRLVTEIDEIVTMWNEQKMFDVSSDLTDQWDEFNEEVTMCFENLCAVVMKWDKLSAELVSLLQAGAKLLTAKAEPTSLHEWLEKLKGSHHYLCENRSDWLNQKELLRQTFATGETDDVDDKEDGQEMDVEDLSEQETNEHIILALESMESKTRQEEEEGKRIEALERLLRDIEAILNSQSTQQRLTFDLADYYQLHVGTERMRAPEILFQPSIIGMEQGGVAETLEYILTQYDSETQSRLVKNVFLTGGSAGFPNMVKRFEMELRAIRPFQSAFKVNIADDPVLDAWKGAARWSSNKDRFEDGSLTRADYLEKGGEYLKEHLASNLYFASPAHKR